MHTHGWMATGLSTMEWEEQATQAEHNIELGDSLWKAPVVETEMLS